MDFSDSDFNISSQEDLTVEILRKLPVKSLIRFCCMCKSWKTLIRSNDNFIKSHLKLSLCKNPNRTTNVLFYSEPNFKKIRYLDQLLIPGNLSLGPHFTLVGSCNGIICYYNNVIIRGNSMNLCLRNPATHEFRSFPDGNYFGRVYVVFFYDSINDDYRIVKFCHISVSSSSTELYILNSNTCKLKNFSCNFPPIARRSNIVVHKRVIHWVTIPTQGPILGALYAFDINEEKLVEILLPGSEFRTKPKPWIGVFDERISLFAWGIDFEIWFLKESVWKRKFVLVDPFGIHSPYGISSYGMILALNWDGKDVFI
ncbi:hypothetical protein M9H77_34130 [Catharanthus roseus]|uniref:Uncharacterized protein n=1 Tax=Catharanthus roseus TaxID=4058 RepID=A0ACB9ZKL8_CATRO|nr:hypothetical protein M9H77_34130 [Catharanthus roseus]